MYVMYACMYACMSCNAMYVWQVLRCNLDFVCVQIYVFGDRLYVYIYIYIGFDEYIAILE